MSKEERHAEAMTITPTNMHRIMSMGPVVLWRHPPRQKGH